MQKIISIKIWCKKYHLFLLNFGENFNGELFADLRFYILTSQSWYYAIKMRIFPPWFAFFNFIFLLQYQKYTLFLVGSFTSWNSYLHLLALLNWSHLQREWLLLLFRIFNGNLFRFPHNYKLDPKEFCGAFCLQGHHR